MSTESTDRPPGPQANRFEMTGRDQPGAPISPGRADTMTTAQVMISRWPGETALHVSPGGLSLVPRLANRVWIARKVLDVQRARPSLLAPQPLER